MRPIEELAVVNEPAWPLIEEWIRQAAVAVNVLPLESVTAGKTTLYRLQVTAQSPLGALALNVGGLIVDQGWLRILGGGAAGLPNLAEANGLEEPTESSVAPGHLVVGYDVLGGTFAVNHLDLPGERGEICYFGPDTLAWTPIGILGHGNWLEWALAGGAAEAFADLRWPDWEADISGLHPGQGINVYPPLFSVEGQGPDVSRRAVPLAELRAFRADTAAQLEALGNPEQIQLRVTD